MNNLPTNTPAHSGSPLPPGTHTLGLWFILLSLTMLFVASLVLFAVARMKALTWPPADMPTLPHSLWISTGILLVLSVTIQSALVGIRHGHPRVLRDWITVTGILALGFLACQTWTWLDLARQGMPPTTRTLYSFVFYLLTVLHAVHVLGGLIPLGIVTGKAWGGRYSASDCEGVKQCAMYWHFLDAIWLVIFAVVYLDALGFLKG